MRIESVIFVHNPPQWNRNVFTTLFSVTLYPLIRWATQSEWNHCALLCIDEKGYWIVEGQFEGVIKTPYGKWLKRARRRVKRLHYQADGAHVESLVGTRYDLTSLLFFKLIKTLTGKWIGKKGKAAKKRLTCSELVAIALGINDFWDKTPQDCYEYMQEQHA